MSKMSDAAERVWAAKKSFPRFGKNGGIFSKGWKIFLTVLGAALGGMAQANEPIYSNGFNEASAPGWASENVAGSGGSVTLVTSGSSPTCSPYEGARMVKFNSYDCSADDAVRWKMTNALNAGAASGLLVEFAWHRDSQYEEYYDYVVPEWSADGAVWNEMDSVERYHDAGSVWTRATNALPPEADYCATLFLAFRFVSGYGNNCYLDDLKLIGQPPTILSVTPGAGPVTGGYFVAVGGRDFGGGTAVTNVTLAGIAAAILTQSMTQVVVRAGAAPGPLAGDTVVDSTTAGRLVLSNSFAYMNPLLFVLDATGARITNNAPAGTAAGTDFGGATIGATLSASFALTNAGSALTVGPVTTNGTGKAAFNVDALPSALEAGATSGFEMSFTPAALGVQTAAVRIVNSSTNSPYRLNVRGVGYALSRDNAPLAGGDPVTLYGASWGGTITGILVCGAAAEVVSQTSTSVTFRLAAGAAGTGAVVAQYAGGSHTVANAFTYNPAGSISGEPEWEETTNLPWAMSYFSAVVAADNKIYTAGGWDGDRTTNCVLRFDPAHPENEWETLTPLPEDIESGSLATRDGILYLAGGEDDNAEALNNDVWSYDTDDPASGWTSVSSLPTGRSYAACADVGGQFTLAGGFVTTDDATWRRTNIVAALDLNNPTGGWSARTPLPKNLDGASGVAFDNWLLVAGGRTSNFVPSREVYALNPSQPTNPWSVHATMPLGHSYFGALRHAGLLVTLGALEETVEYTATVSTVYGLDRIGSNVWRRLNPLPLPLENFASCEHDGLIYLIGGYLYTGPETPSFHSPFVWRGTVFPGVWPAVGLVNSTNVVQISGQFLGNGSDITNVILGGVSATILTQGQHYVVAQLPPLTSLPNSNVIVRSYGFGETVKSNAFSLGHPGFVLTGADGGSMTNNQPASRSSGTDFGYLLLGQNAETALYLSNPGPDNTITSVVTNGAGKSAYQIGAPSIVRYSEEEQVAIRFAPGAIGLYTAQVVMAHSGTNTPWRLNLAGRILSLSGTNGPAAGGNRLTIAGAGLDTVTNALLCDVLASIFSKSATQLVLIAGAKGFGLTGDLTLQFSAGDPVSFEGVYTYNPPPKIFGELTAWQSFSNLPASIQQMAAVATSNHIVTIGGGSSVSSVFYADPAQPELGWNSASSLPVNRYAGSGGVYGDTIFSVGGLSSFMQYNKVYILCATNMGSGWTETNSLPAYRYQHTGGVVDDKLFVVGGRTTNASHAYNTLWWTDARLPTNRWIEGPYLPFGIRQHAGAVLDGVIFVAGGENAGGILTNRVWSWNTRSTNFFWDELPVLPQRLRGAAGAAVNGRFYVIGGEDVSYNELTSVYVYDTHAPASGWTEGPSLPYPRSYAGAVVFGEDIFVLGGYSNSAERTAWRGVHRSGVSPDLLPLAGGQAVTIRGENLGADDVTNVTLAGIAAASIVSQTPTQLVVIAGVSTNARMGDVIVQSASFGLAVRSNAFSYARAGLLVRDASGSAVGSGEAATTAYGTDFGGALSGVTLTNGFAVTNSGSALAIGGVTTNGTGASAFRVIGLPTNLAARSGAPFAILFTPPAAGLYTAAVRIANNSLTNPYVINLRGVGVTVDRPSGPASGGTVVTLTGANFGDGSDITNVWLAGFAAEIVTQGVNYVTIRTGEGVWGGGPAALQSTSRGTLTIPNAFTYNPRGSLGGGLLGWTALSNLPRAVSSPGGGAGPDGKIYCAGGYDLAAWNNTAAVNAYDPADPEAGWTAIGNMPIARGGSSSFFTLGDEILLAGGYYGGDNNVVLRYNTTNPAAGWSYAPGAWYLPEGRSTAGAIQMDGRFYIVGGRTNGTYATASVLAMDAANPSAGWTNIQSLDAKRYSPFTAGAQGWIFAFGGYAGGATDCVEKLCPARPADPAVVLPSLPTSLQSGVCAEYAGRIYLIGGMPGDNRYTNGVLEYTPTRPEDGWRPAAPLPIPVSAAALAKLGSSVYVFGGTNTTCWRGDFAPAAAPARGTLAGGETIVLTGMELGDGADITNVFLAGIKAASIVSQSSTQVVVTSGAAVAPTSGAVVVQSVSRGETVASNAFAYTGPEIAVYASSGAAIANNASASAGLGTAFGLTALHAPVTNWFSVSNAGSRLAISSVTTSGAGRAAFRVIGMPACVEAQSASNFAVAFRPTLAQGYTAAVSIANSSTTTPFRINVTGQGVQVAPTTCSSEGGRTLTLAGHGLSDGSTGDVLGVTLCGARAAIVSQSATQLVIVAGPDGVETGDIAIRTASAGILRLRDAFVYYPRGAIFGAVTGWTNSLPPLPIPLRYAAAATYGSRAIVGGGGTAAFPTNRVFMLDTTNAGAGWTELPPMPSNRWHHAFGVSGGKLYSVGGYASAGGTVHSNTWMFDLENPGAGWTNLPVLPKGLVNLAVIGVGERIWQVGGYADSGDQNTVRYLDAQDPALGWRAGPTLPATRSGPGAASRGVIYMAGGSVSGNYSANCVAMDALNGGAWTAFSNLPSTASSLGAVAAQYGRIYRLANYASAEYNIAAPEAAWSNMVQLPLNSLQDFVAAAPASGGLLLLGGYDSSYGIVQSNAYEAVFSSGVTPAAVPVAGNVTVAINGYELGNGGDVTNVTLCGVAATILSQTSTQLLVRAGNGAAAAGSAVRVWSASRGLIERDNAFSYTDPNIEVRFGGSTGAMVTNGAAPNPAVGTDYGNQIVGGGAGRWFSVGALPVDMTISTVRVLTADALGVTVSNWPANVTGGSYSSFNVRVQAMGVGVQTAQVRIVNNSTNASPFNMNIQARGYSVSTNNGPGAGGNRITIYGRDIGNGSDITGVLVRASLALIVSQNMDSVTVELSPGSGSGAITIYSLSRGTQTVAGAYTYNPTGVITFAAVESGYVSNLAVGVRYPAAAALSNRIYCVGGFNGAADIGQALVYDPALPDAGWVAISNTSPVEQHTLSEMGGQLYLVGGSSGGTAQDAVYRYDTTSPGGGWVAIPNLPAARYSHAAAVWSNRLYVLGGLDAGDTVRAEAFVFDPIPSPGAWSAFSNLPAPRYAHGAAVVSNRLYVMGGLDSGFADTNTTWSFDLANPAAGWRAESSLPLVLSYAPAVQLENRLYTLGGYSGGSRQSLVNVLDVPNTNAPWESAFNLSYTRAYGAAAAHDGWLYYLGGRSSSYSYEPTVYRMRPVPPVVPDRGAQGGGYTVTVSGRSLGNGGDITNVTLAGIPATIVSQTNMQVVVHAGAAPDARIGAVVVQSTSYGTSIRSNAFEYLAGGSFTITATFGAHGTITPSGAVSVAAGGRTNFQIAANTYWHILSILTNGAAAPITNASRVTVVWSNVAAHGTLHAEFDANMATNNTPEWWLAQYGWTSNFNARATNDFDNDGIPTWQEYPADTDPTRQDSALRMQTIGRTGLRWAGGTGVVQYLEQSGNLFSNAWKVVATNLPPTAVSNSAPLLLDGGNGFYRLRAVR